MKRGRTGVYLLVGPDPGQSSKELVYVGETDNVLKRLLQHDKDEQKDFWSRTVLITSKDENLTKSHVRYLESRLIRLARDAGRANLTNDTEPEPSSLPESDVADMEFFLEQEQMVLPVLGLSFTQPRPALTAASASVESPLFELHQVGAHATGREIDGELVLKGSTARRQGVDSWTSYKSLRDQLVDDGRLVEADDPDYLRFAEDVTFSSPSAAGACVLGRNTNGRQAWRVKDTGSSYQQWYEEKLRNAGLGTAPSTADADPLSLAGPGIR